MLEKEIEVSCVNKDGTTGKAKAILILCPACEGPFFGIFIVNGHNHLQCVECGVSYCQGGDCSEGVSEPPSPVTNPK